MGDYCSYIRYAKFNKIEMKFDFTELDDQHCQDLQNAKLYYISYGDDDLWRIGAKGFYDSLVKNFDDVIGG